MGRVPSRCIVLLEDLDAAFTRSLTRSDKKGDKSGDKDKEKKGSDNEDEESSGSSHRHRRRHKENLSDVNTLTLSGLLNALDGVAASEGRILFAYVWFPFILGSLVLTNARTFTQHNEPSRATRSSPLPSG